MFSIMRKFNNKTEETFYTNLHILTLILERKQVKKNQGANIHVK